MLRLTDFAWHQPTSLEDAIALKQEAGTDGMFVAGGTDLYPNVKRRHQTPGVVISLAAIPELECLEAGPDGATIGAGVRLTDIVNHPALRQHCPVIPQTAATISTPLLRNMGTLGGNLCLDTRCNYYNQSFEWRKAINFCMKCDGEICWVAPSSPRCWAVQSSDLAPVMVAIGAHFDLVGPGGTRTVSAHQFYHDDGIAYLTKDPDEILTAVRVPPSGTWDATYWKLRRRGSFDFPVLGVAIRLDWDDRRVRKACITLGGVASHPQLVTAAAEALVGTFLDDTDIAAAADAAFRPSKPMDNTDFGLAWRKQMTREYVRRALQELRDRRNG